MDSRALLQCLGSADGERSAWFAVPIVFKLHDGIHDGIEAIEAQPHSLTLVDKMAALCVTTISRGSYVLLDAYYASAKVLQPLRQHGLHLISRARISTVAYAAFSRCPDKQGRG